VRAGMHTHVYGGIIAMIAALHRSAPFNTHFIFEFKNGHVISKRDADIDPFRTFIIVSSIHACQNLPVTAHSDSRY
jgi:hypothetical protein